MMTSRAALALLLSLRGASPAAASEWWWNHHKDKQEGGDGTSIPSWQRFASNANYRITAVLEVNGGADAGPNFETFTGDGVKLHADGEAGDAADADADVGRKSSGYSVPIEVLTLLDKDGKYRQRVSYYGGMQVDYNDDGGAYKVISTPYSKDGGGNEDEDDDVCFFMGGSAEGGDAKEKVGYLNFFPTVEQMEHYTLGNLITNEPGVPYRIATLESAHGTFDAASDPSQPDASYDSKPGMPSEDWFQFHYEESLSSSRRKKTAANAKPIKWTMLARNQIINSHTENWVIRYLNYEAIDGTQEEKMWGEWFDAKFEGACGDGRETYTLAEEGKGMLSSRLGMFFSTSSHAPATQPKSLTVAEPTNGPSGFDVFLARHNRHYPHPEDYSKRQAIHDSNVNNIAKWNKEHAGKARFAPNEFMDLEAKEVMQFRGGHIPKGKRKAGRLSKGGRGLRRANDSDEESVPSFLLGNGEDGDEFPTHVVPDDFDPSTLPEAFDWRDHLPGSVLPVKDQGFCGSCWAFSFISALESHWFIAHGQSVALPEQFVNDCAWSDASHACDGGNADAAAADILNKFGGQVPSRDAYGGYLSVDGGCYVDVLQGMGIMDDAKAGVLSTDKATTSVRLTNWVYLPERDDVAMKHALLTQGPVSVAVNVVDEALYYADGVLDVESCTEYDLDHAVVLVGWGADDLPGGGRAEHWILRNSWSDLWGDAGYFRVRMGKRDCGVTSDAGYPTVERPKSSGGELDAGLTGKVATS